MFGTSQDACKSDILFAIDVLKLFSILSSCLVNTNLCKIT